jgi:hypothetical protein
MLDMIEIQKTMELHHAGFWSPFFLFALFATPIKLVRLLSLKIAFEAWIHQRMNVSLVGWLAKLHDVEIIIDRGRSPRIDRRKGIGVINVIRSHGVPRKGAYLSVRPTHDGEGKNCI